MRLKRGDLFFIMHHDSGISKLIAWAMSSQWSHCGLIYDVSEMHDYTLETNSYCVTHGTMRDYINNPNVTIEVYRPICDQQMLDYGVEEARHKLFGAVYGYFQLLSLGIRRLFMQFKFKINNFIRQSVVCCHVVGYAYKAARVIGFESIDPEGFDTEELYQKVKASNHFRQVFKK